MTQRWRQCVLMVAAFLFICVEGLPKDMFLCKGTSLGNIDARERDPRSMERLRGGGIGIDRIGQRLMRGKFWPEPKQGGKEEQGEVHMRNKPAAPHIHKLHLPRKAFHLAAGCLFAGLLNSVLDKETFVGIFAGLGFGGIFGETLRINTTAFNRFFFAVFGACMREHEVNNNFSGMVYYLLGVAAAGMCDTVSGVIGILMLTFGDPAAGAFGWQGKRLLKGSGLVRSLSFPNGKTAMGSTGCFATCSLVCALVLRAARYKGGKMPLLPLLTFSAAMGGITTFVEAIIPSPPLTLPFKSLPLGLDDNLVLPAVSALTAQILLPLLGVSPKALNLPAFLLF